ncbi:MAG: DUF393 domain-containing protein [Spirochaetaceae bacterium]|nr:DUF393 domain-containing protein [Myxococcales bacterium]MCB9725153.1 DUF393 domain-containing protein [Spirochaetaceae bacterium]
MPDEATSWEIRVLYDADCPLCSREVALLRRLDRGRGRIDFEDIAAPDFDPARYALDQASVEARLHGVLPDGRIVDGVDVLVRAWSAVGFRLVAVIARLPGVRWLLDRAYDVFARNRLRWTGRCDDRCAPSRPNASSGSRSPRTS